MQPATERGANLAPKPSLTNYETVLEPPTRANAREEGLENHQQLCVPMGASPRTESRLKRTAERLGIALVYETPHQETK